MSPFAKALYPWEHSVWSVPTADLCEAYLKESRIDDLPKRAAQAGLSAEEFLARLGSRAVFDSELQKPDWLRWLEAAQHLQISDEASKQLPIASESPSVLGDSERALLSLFETEIRHALNELEREFVPQFGKALAPHLVSLCLPELLKRIWTLAHPALLLELKLARQKMQLTTATPTLRFVEFCAQLKTTRRTALQEVYPLLWRDVASFCINQKSRRRELFADIKRHADELSTWFGFPCDLQNLRRIQSDVADLHNGGRATLLLHFQSPSDSNSASEDAVSHRICAYKPRDLRIESNFLEFYQSTLAAQNRETAIPMFLHGRQENREYGFMQYVVHRELANGETPAEYAWRMGALLAIADALLGNDLHYENIVAVGCTPIPIDIETLFQPFMRAELGGEMPGDLMRMTLFRVGLLPRTHANAATEFSPLFANEGKAYPAKDFVDVGTDMMRLESFQRRRTAKDSHLPRDSTGVHALLSERQSLEQGWIAVRQFIEDHWAEFTQFGGAFEKMSHLRVRLITRATDHYHMIVRAISAPRYLQCTAKRLALIDRLWQGFVPSNQDGKRFQCEVEALAQNEIPYFFGYPRLRELRTEQACVPGAFPESAWNQVLARAKSRKENFARDLAALRTAFVVSLEHDHRLRKLPIRKTPLRTFESRHAGWQAVVRNVADLLIVRKYEDSQQCGWLRFEASNEGFSIRATPLDLYAGLAGIGLSFARLAASEYGQKQDLETAQQCFSSIAFRLRSNPLAVTSVGFSGAGGVMYGAALVSAFLSEVASADSKFDQIEATCLRFLQSKRVESNTVEEMDVIGGAAGALLGLCAAWQNGTSQNRPTIQAEIRAWVSRILDKARPAPTSDAVSHVHTPTAALNASDAGVAWPSTNYPTMLTGMAHGACGIAIALRKANECLQASEALNPKTLHSALRFETSFIQQPGSLWRDARFGIVDGAQEYCMAWCHGAPGLLMARLVIPDATLDVDAFSTQLERVIAEGFEDDWVLCHGALGQLMILRQMMHAGRLSIERFTEIECAVLDAWERAWPVLSQQAIQPGLFDGLAGAMYCALDMLDVGPSLDLLAYATQLKPQGAGPHMLQMPAKHISQLRS